MLRTRALSAAVLIPLVAGLTYAGGWLLAVALLVVSVRAAYELFQLMKEAGYRPSLQATTVVMGLLIAIARFPDLKLLGLVLAASVILTLIWQLLRPPEGHPLRVGRWPSGWAGSSVILSSFGIFHPPLAWALVHAG
jgi:CDP-diglyceride synthetase